MKFWRVEFVISDRKNRAKNRFVFEEEFVVNQNPEGFSAAFHEILGSKMSHLGGDKTDQK